MFKVDGRSGRQLTIGNRNYSMAVHIDHSKKNDAKAGTPVLWPPHEKSWLIGKDSDAGRDWGQEEKGTTGDEMAGWHHWLDGRESEWTLGVGDGQGGLACCDSWGCKELDTTELNWTEQRKVPCYLCSGEKGLIWNNWIQAVGVRTPERYRHWWS